MTDAELRELRELLSEPEPKPEPQVQEATSTPGRAFSFTKLIISWAVVLVLAGVWAWNEYGPIDGGGRARSINPIDHYFTTSTEGGFEIWTEALERFDDGEFKDWQDMNESMQSDLNDILKDSEEPSIAAHKSINGKLWVAQTAEQEEEVQENREKARKVLKAFVDGYRKWKR